MAVKADFTVHQYAYEEKGGTTAAARQLEVDEHQVIKTLVMEDESKTPLMVLMHGDLEVSTKALARTIGVKSTTPCEPAAARRHTGYEVGGTSPFGTLKDLPIYVEASIMDLPKILINGGKKGLLVKISPQALNDIFDPIPVKVGR
jgi:Cys-tRNA(Pro) deacylase